VSTSRTVGLLLCSGILSVRRARTFLILRAEGANVGRGQHRGLVLIKTRRIRSCHVRWKMQTEGTPVFSIDNSRLINASVDNERS